MSQYHNYNKGPEPEKKKINRDNIKKLLSLFRFVKPQIKPFIAGLVFLFLSSMANLLFPALLGDLIDSTQAKAVSEINKIALIKFIL